MSRQRARVAVLWAALALALGIGIGLLAFITSIEDSYRARGEAVGGLSDVQVEAVGGSSLPAGLADRLERIGGTRYAIPMAQQRVTLEAGTRDVVATAIGVDRSARRLRSAVQRDLEVPSGSLREAGPGADRQRSPASWRGRAGATGCGSSPTGARRGRGSRGWSTSTRRSRT